MVQPTFDVVFEGHLVAGRSLRDVELLLARSLRVSVDDVHARLVQGRATLQANVDRVAAERWVEAFRQAGALCKLVPHRTGSPGEGLHAMGAPIAPIAPIVPTRASPGSQAEARASDVEGPVRSAAVGPIAPIVPSRAVPEASTASSDMETRLQHGRPFPHDPPPAATVQSPGSPPANPIAPVPIIAATETRAALPASSAVSPASAAAATPPVESGVVAASAPEIPDLEPRASTSVSTDPTVQALAATPDPASEASVQPASPPGAVAEIPVRAPVGVTPEPIGTSVVVPGSPDPAESPLPASIPFASVLQPVLGSPTGDELPPPASIPLGDLAFAGVTAKPEPDQTAPPSANSLVRQLAASSDPQSTFRANEAAAEPPTVSSHLLELDQGDPAAAPIEIDTDAHSNVVAREPRRAHRPIVADSSALSAARRVSAGVHSSAHSALDLRGRQPSAAPRASRAGLWLGAMIVVIVGVGALMAGGGWFLSRQPSAEEAAEASPNAGAARLRKWEVQFTTATRFIVSYQCDDGLDRNIVCWSPIRDQYECTCYRDGYEGNRFEVQGVPTTEAEALALAGPRCGWKLVE